MVHRPCIVQEDVERLLHALLPADDDHVGAHEGKSDIPTPFAPNGDVPVDAIPEPLVVELILNVLHRERPAQEGERVATIGVRDDEGVYVVDVYLPLLEQIVGGENVEQCFQVVQPLVADALQVCRGEWVCVLGQQLQQRADGWRPRTATARQGECGNQDHEQRENPASQRSLSHSALLGHGV